ncbi:hypothetical protein D3C84_874700 [compost metagenome]
MLITQREMQRDTLDQRVQVIRPMRIVMGLIDPLRQHPQSSREARGGRRNMNRIALAVLHHHVIPDPQMPWRILRIVDTGYANAMKCRD